MSGKRVLLVTYGRTYGTVKAYVNAHSGQALSVLKLNRVLPLTDEVVAIAKEYACVLVLEETRGGVGELLGSALLKAGYAGRYGVRSIEETLGACTTAQGLERVGLDAGGIAAFVQQHTEGL